MIEERKQVVLSLNSYQKSEIGEIMDNRISLRVELRADGNFIGSWPYEDKILSLELTSKFRRK